MPTHYLVHNPHTTRALEKEQKNSVFMLGTWRYTVHTVKTKYAQGLQSGKQNLIAQPNWNDKLHLNTAGPSGTQRLAAPTPKPAGAPGL